MNYKEMMEKSRDAMGTKDRIIPITEYLSIFNICPILSIWFENFLNIISQNTKEPHTIMLIWNTIRKASLIKVALVKFILKKNVRHTKKKKIYPSICTSLENNVNTTISVWKEIKNNPIKMAQIMITGKNDTIKLGICNMIPATISTGSKPKSP